MSLGTHVAKIFVLPSVSLSSIYFAKDVLQSIYIAKYIYCQVYTLPSIYIARYTYCQGCIFPCMLLQRDAKYLVYFDKRL